jgi:hypothetical protein
VIPHSPATGRKREEHHIDICRHPEVTCLNQYELIRKYRCLACEGIMMCRCEEDFARRYLPHQLSQAATAGHERISVTLGFQEGVCNTCRGLPEPCCPKGDRPGTASKIRRYYWREISFIMIPLFAKWAETNGYPNWLDALGPHKDVHHDFYLQAVEKVKQMHMRAPKYSYSEESTNEVLERYSVEIVNLCPVRIERALDSMFEFDGKLLRSANEVAERNFEKMGYECLLLESRPLHVLFGVFMWKVIQDPEDPNIRNVWVARKLPAGVSRDRGTIRTLMPPDFGTHQYSERRTPALEKHFSALPHRRADLLSVFGLWLGPSYPLRSYLAGHRSEDVERARQLLSVLPGDSTLRILRYLTVCYWERYCGWPDMLFHRSADYFLAEVKFSGDGLKVDQKEWVRGNANELHLPFKLIRVHRTRPEHNRHLARVPQQQSKDI